MKCLPTINLNGTSYEELVRQQEHVITKINEALEAMSDAAPHGRDFLPAGHRTSEEILYGARQEHLARMLQLTQARDAHAKILQYLVEAHIEQERMRGHGAL